MTSAHRIGVVTSGGDCPGLNAAIRAVVRSAAAAGWSVLGIRRGYEGLLRGETATLDAAAVSGIINRGGTILHTARSEAFHTPEGLRQAAAALDRLSVSGLIVLGGNGSLRGAWELSRLARAPIIGIPKSIDNDVGGTDYAIGFDTAVNTVLEAIDRIRDTATSHDRLFVIEVMGRKNGYLALAAGLAGGAEEVVVPETPTDVEAICRRLEQGRQRGKRSSIIVVAEGDETGGAFALAGELQRRTDYDIRVSVLGHQQRGGAPTAFDRILASRPGAAAVAALRDGQRGKVVGLVHDEVVVSDLETAWRTMPRFRPELADLASVLSS
jgi:6-phosphofructokinase 1